MGTSGHDRFEEGRHLERLAVAERRAATSLDRLGVATVEPELIFVTRPGPIDAATLAAAQHLPDADVPAVRIVLLRIVAESTGGDAGSTHGRLRVALAGRGVPPDPADVALELALCRFAMERSIGSGVGWRRLQLLEPCLDDLDRIEAMDATADLLDEAERLADLLATEFMAMEGASGEYRVRLVRFLARIDGDRLPALAWDPGDPFGADMRLLVGTDEDLGRGLAHLLPLAVGRTAAMPGTKQRSLIDDLAGHPETRAVLRAALGRTAHQLLVAPLEVRGPGFLTIRPTNQRLARAVIWLVPAILPESAIELLGELGLRLGTSGRRDNQARDAGLAHTAAALLGELADESSVAALARMRTRVRNKPVAKQVDKALEAAAARADVGIEDLVAASLPTFGLDAERRRAMPVGSWTAEVRLDDAVRVAVSWHGPDGSRENGPPVEVSDAFASDVRRVADLVDDLRGELRDERNRLERQLAEERIWPVAEWQRRYLGHPLRLGLARGLIWRLDAPSGPTGFLPSDDGFVAADGSRTMVPGVGSVRLWHPVEASPDEVERWRDLLVERRVVQPFKQAYRETYEPPIEPDAMLDRRFADRPLAYAQMRALMGARGWSAPMLGPFDQGDRSVAYRDVRSHGMRAEFGHVPAGLPEPTEAVAFSRSGGLRFTIPDGEARRPVLLARIPRRLLSEALRDVDLFTSVPDPTRRPGAGQGDTAAVAARTAALTRLIPTLPFGRHLKVVGIWLLVESGEETFSVSLADGRTLRLRDEVEIEVPRRGESDAASAAPYRPSDDDEVLARVLEAAANLAQR